MTVVVTKTCSTCHRRLPATLEYFYASPVHALGLQSYCKRCRLAYGRAYYAMHRVHLLRQAQAMRAADPEGWRAYHAVWRDTHRAHYRAYQRAYKRRWRAKREVA